MTFEFVARSEVSGVRPAKSEWHPEALRIADGNVSGEFTRRFYDTQLFWDKYAGGKFAEYLFKAKEFIATGNSVDADRAVQLLQEAQLFIDAAHDCHNKALGSVQSAVTIAPSAQPSI